MFDPRDIRSDFPILQREVHGKPLVYLDNAATSQKPRQVIDTLTRFYEWSNSNVHRGIHTLAEEATDQYEGARRKVVRFVGASGPEEIIFTRNTTEAINLVALSWGRANIGEGDEILTTEMEHHSNLVPWQMLAQATGATLRLARIRDDGTLDMRELERLIGSRTKLVAMTHMSNVLGTINPVAEVARLAHRQGALMLVDGAQSVPHMPIDVRLLDCDFLAFSSHKMLGPTGIGVLYARRELLERMEPIYGGGDMISRVEEQRSTWNDLPWKFEAGTPNFADAVAFGAAIDYLSVLGMAEVREHERELTAYALEALGDVPHVKLYGPTDPARRGGTVAFNYGGLHPHDLATVLDYEGVAVRGGHHCCQVLMRRLDVPGTTRASFYVYNTREDVDTLVGALAQAKEVFGDVAGRPL